MTPWRLFYSAAAGVYGATRDAFLDALFPIPPAEREVLALGAENAFRTLPRCGHPRLGEATAIFAYGDERVSRLVWAIKYKKSHNAAGIAGYALARMLHYWHTALPDDMSIILVPMPITRQRRRERGYNQCELILEEVQKLGAERGLLFAYAPELLVRVRHTSRQTMKDRAERLESAENLFAVNRTAVHRLRPHAERIFIVVIDDVITTGSTMNDAIETLRAAGLSHTYGLSVAH